MRKLPGFRFTNYDFCIRWTAVQRFPIKAGARASQLKKAMAVAFMKLAQGFTEQAPKSLERRVVIAADPHAALKISVPLTYGQNIRVKSKLFLHFIRRNKDTHDT